VLSMDLPTKRPINKGELERLKYFYLPMWSEWVRFSRVGRGLPSQVPYCDYMKPMMPDNFDSDERPDPWAVRIIDASVDEVGERVSLARAALGVRYLNAAGPSVYRSGRLVHLDLEHIEDICDEAERLMVAIVKRRNLPL